MYVDRGVFQEKSWSCAFGRMVNNLLPPSWWLSEGSSWNDPNDQPININQPISDRWKWLAVKRGMGFEDIGGEEEDRQQCDGRQPIALRCKQLWVSWCLRYVRKWWRTTSKVVFSHSNLSNSQFDYIKAVDEFPPSETSRRNSLPSVELWSSLCPKLCKMDARAFALRRTTFFGGNSCWAEEQTRRFLEVVESEIDFLGCFVL